MTRSRTLPTLPTIAAFILGAVVLSAAVGYLMRPRTLSDARTIDASQLGERVLVIAPHPDDEVLTAGGTIHRLLARGAQVRVVIVTAGDGYYRAAKRLTTGPTGPAAYLHLGDVRHEESLAAAARLGLPASDVISLGFPDAGTSELWDTDWDASKRYVGRTEASATPYPWALEPNAPYTGTQLASELVRVMRDFRPDTVIGPDTRETHPDHAAVGTFTLFAMDEAGFTGRRLTAFVHFKHYPYPWAYIPGASLAPPPVLVGRDSTWLTLPLEAADETAKHAAIGAYASQNAVADLAVYMRAFLRRNELFDDRLAATPATQVGDARPAEGTAGTVLVTPAPVIPGLAHPGRIGSVRVVRGAGVVWVGLVSDAPVDPAFQYRLDVRLIGGTRPTERLGVLVSGGAATAVDASSDSTAPAGIATQADGHTVWISVPASVFEGRTHALLGTASGPAGRSPFRTSWRDVSL
jgi:N-acetyl-1-D-myo-inositol-2-amino-2-deoxy-alpha-D-glucopyranoside deacetylase